MADTATAADDTTIVNSPEPVATDTAAVLFPTTSTGEAKETSAAGAATVTPTTTDKTAEQLVADKIAADKALADKTVADKAIADKAAADKAIADKTAQTTPETKTPTEKEKAEAEKATTTTPKDYDLKLPEGSPLSAEDLAQTLKDAKAAGLSKEQAESLLASKDQGAKALQTRQESEFKKVQTQWKADIANDPEMGGEKIAETVQLASRAFKSLASAELQIWADKTGLGNYPEFVRLMAKVGRMMGEDKFIRGTVGNNPEPKSRESILYGKTTPDGSGNLTP